MSALAGSHVFHRQPAKTPPVAVRGEGIYLFDAEGRRYLDGSGGAAVSALGHGHPRIIAAIARQAETLAYAHTAFLTSAPAEALAANLIEKAPDGFERVYFVSGGSEAMETSIKLARAYHVARGESDRTLFISRHQSYHGNTLGALSLSGNPKRREVYEPLLFDHPKIAPCYEYRGKRAGESPEDYGLRAANELEAAILKAGPENVAAFVAETVVGATLGACPPAPGYFRRIREICDAYGVLYIADEVMCGMGRTGCTFAVETDDVAPDLIAVAKGLGGGYQPIGAVLVNARVFGTLRAKGFEHGHTYVGHPIACAAALAVQEEIDDSGLLANVRARGDQIRAALRERLAPLGIVGEVRGRGLMIGVEFVANPETRAPFHPAQRFAAALKDEAMAHGLICYPGSGTADGAAGDHVLIAPPYTITSAEADDLVDRLAAALEALLLRARSA